jgi:hypothetical protein
MCNFYAHEKHDMSGESKGDATTITIVQESTIFTINVQLSTIIVTVFLIVTIDILSIKNNRES